MDERQADIFGAAAPTPPAARKPSRRKDSNGDLPALNVPDAPAADTSIDAFAARLSPADLDELAAALPDDALAHLVLVAVRQLRRRLARASGRGGKGRGSALERAARQVAAELGGTDGSDYA